MEVRGDRLVLAPDITGNSERSLLVGRQGNKDDSLQSIWLNLAAVAARGAQMSLFAKDGNWGIFGDGFGIK